MSIEEKAHIELFEEAQVDLDAAAEVTCSSSSSDGGA